MSGFDIADIHRALQETLKPTALEVVDESLLHAGHAEAGSGAVPSHIRIRAASPQFSGRSTVQSHRLVYDALAVFFAGGLHAVAIELLQAKGIE